MQENQKIEAYRFNPESADWVKQMNALGKSGTPFFFLVDFECKNPVVIPLEEIEGSGIYFRFPQIETRDPFEPMYLPFTVKPQPISFDVYEKGFNRAMQAIQAGDTYLINLTYATPINNDFTLHQAYYIAQADYKVYWKGKFTVFSPEQFVSIENGVIRTFPMKGTIDASVLNAEATLLADLKEQEEHATVVDLLRNDLSIVADKVSVARYRFISKIRTHGKTLLQTSTEIKGQLTDHYAGHLGDIMQALLPAGSVTGAPKKRTVELIKEIEPEPRGYYTGVCGVFDGRSLESAVMIRMIEQREDGYYYRSGGGITYQSNARAEYQEMIDKVYVPMP